MRVTTGKKREIMWEKHFCNHRNELIVLDFIMKVVGQLCNHYVQSLLRSAYSDSFCDIVQ